MARSQDVKENIPATPATATAKPKKLKKNNRAVSEEDKYAIWTLDDNAALIEHLKIERIAGNQSDNGWKSLVWTGAAQKLNKMSTQGGVKTPNKCRDHWTRLKQAYVAIDWLRYKASGFGWDDSLHLVTAPDDVWDRLGNKEYEVWRKKPFPLFDEIAELCVDCVADGRDALNITEATTKATDGSQSRSLKIFNDFEDASDSECEITGPATPAPMSKKLKRSASDDSQDTPMSKKQRGRLSGAEAIDGVATELRELRHSLSAPVTIETGGGPTTPERRAQAVKLVCQDLDFSPNEKVQIFKLLRKNKDIADTFITVDDDELRRYYIRSELD